MLDVHVPHATHTWKDFWIHLGTIAAGLLIAISLEQGVVALVRLHEQHKLEASLRLECETNKERAEVDFVVYDDEMTWLLGLHEDIGRMLATGGKANLPYRAFRNSPVSISGTPWLGGPMAMLTSAWDTANADNRLALLPDDMSHAYSLLYHTRGERFANLRLSFDDALNRQAAFEARFANISEPRIPLLARMGAADLKQYDELVMTSFTSARAAKQTLRQVYGSNQAVLQGIYDFASELSKRRAEQTGFMDNYEKIAQRVAAETTERDKAAAIPDGKPAR